VAEGPEAEGLESTPPPTTLTTPVPAGSTTMEVADQAGMRAGDKLDLIDPGVVTERVEIASVGSVVLTAPTVNSFPAGSIVSHVPAGSGLSAPPAPSAPTVKAFGDPHLVNVHGERFDIFQEGTHVLLLIPKGAFEKAFLNVVAEARRSGVACSDLYFKTLNVTGKWAEEIRKGGLQYFASRPSKATSETWMHFRSVDLKVRWGHTGDGIEYLNLFVRHLGMTGFQVGGLLGEDDHKEIATRTKGCKQTVSLVDAPHAGEAMAKAEYM
jgi:hypothetical protein